MTARVEFKKLYQDSILPKKAYKNDAGFDLYAHSITFFSDINDLSEPYILYPGARALVKCGFGMALPTCFEAQVRPRSGLALKYGIGIVNSPGTIDQNFRGEIGVIIINYGEAEFKISKNDRIAQLVIHELTEIEAVEVEELSNTERSQAGFGSSGK